jgi:hypothetical protein
MRFASSTISFYIEPSCSLEKQNKMREAFFIISNQTQIISFNELQNTKADIFVQCSGKTKYNEDNSFIKGEGGPREYYNFTPFSLIQKGEITLHEDVYKVDCKEPIVEIHELLHVFGFDHVNNKSSVLYPYFSCGQELGQNIPNSLVKLYSVKPLPELTIQSINATKHGKYLDFNISLQNHGLITATNIKLTLTNSDGKSYEIDNMAPGISTSIQITNHKLKSSNINSVSFEIKAQEDEYSALDNKQTLNF